MVAAQAPSPDRRTSRCTWRRRQTRCGMQRQHSHIAVFRNIILALHPGPTHCHTGLDALGPEQPGAWPAEGVCAFAAVLGATTALAAAMPGAFHNADASLPLASLSFSASMVHSTSIHDPCYASRVSLLHCTHTHGSFSCLQLAHALPSARSRSMTLLQSEHSITQHCSMYRTSCVDNVLDTP